MHPSRYIFIMCSHPVMCEKLCKFYFVMWKLIFSLGNMCGDLNQSTCEMSHSYHSDSRWQTQTFITIDDEKKQNKFFLNFFFLLIINCCRNKCRLKNLHLFLFFSLKLVVSVKDRIKTVMSERHSSVSCTTEKMKIVTESPFLTFELTCLAKSLLYILPMCAMYMHRLT